jgi:uncharacterized protein YeaO (DUF488 family)
MARAKPAAPALRRVYEPRAPQDGTRVLVERLWPRGVRKEDPRIDLWLKDLSPSPELRRWFAHEAEKWPEFQRRYRAELDAAGSPTAAAVAELRDLIAQGPVTLVYAARDPQMNSALVLREWLGEG